MSSRRVRLNKRSIDGLPPRTVRYDMYDSDLPGYHVRIHPSGLKTLRLKYSASGRQRVGLIGEFGRPWTADDARREAERLRGLIRSGVDPVAQREDAKRRAKEESRRAITLGVLVERWLEEGRDAAPTKRESSWETDASCLRHHIVTMLGDVLLKDLRKSDIERVQRRIASGETASDKRTGKTRGRSIVRGGPGIARRSLAALSACLNWAIDQELVETNVVSRVKKLPQGRRERFLSSAEAQHLLSTMETMQRNGEVSDTFADVIRLLLFTGARRSEIARLEWSEVDLDRGVIVLPRHRSKTGEKVIVLSRYASEILSARPRTGVHVFPSSKCASMPIVGVSRAWQRVRGRAGLCDVRIHDLRHSFASFAAANGASLLAIGKALGHTQPSTTARYAHLSNDPIRELTEGVGREVFRGLARRAS